MPKVIFKKSTYQYEVLKPKVDELMDSLGGDLFKETPRVLIKPNLLIAAGPERGITTHPLVVKAVAEYVLARGGRVQVSDSPRPGFL